MSNLKGKKVLIISGPTVEKIDPVRYISNFSSGKMGDALCRAFADVGAKVHVVSGPVNVSYRGATKVFNVTSAIEMLHASQKELLDSDIVICCAAVCDFRPKNVYREKLKKGKDDANLENIELEKNPDILKTLSKEKNKDQFIVGFCAETENLLENAKEKMLEKNCDLIVANDVSSNKVFGKNETNAIILFKNGDILNFPKVTKVQLAQKISEIPVFV